MALFSSAHSCSRIIIVPRKKRKKKRPTSSNRRPERGERRCYFKRKRDKSMKKIVKSLPVVLLLLWDWLSVYFSVAAGFRLRFGMSQYALRNIPEFYLEPLELREPMTELASDLFQGCPMSRSARLFDDQWEQKYIQCSY